MDSWLLAVIIKPIVFLIVFGGICLPIRWSVNKFMPEGKIKNSLLKHRFGPKDSLCR